MKKITKDIVVLGLCYSAGVALVASIPFWGLLIRDKNNL